MDTLRIITPLFALGALTACASEPVERAQEIKRAPAMIIVNEQAVTVDEAPPHGRIGMSTAYRISDNVPDRTMEFRKRSLHIGAAVGVHPISHDEVYYVLSGSGVVVSDGEEAVLTSGMAAYLYDGAEVGIRQTGNDPLVLIIAYPLPGHDRLK